MRELFLSRSAWMGASSRYCSYQYFPWLERGAMECVMRPLFDDDCLRLRYQTGRAEGIDVLKGFVGLMASVFAARSFDVVVVENMLLSYLTGLPEWLLNRLAVHIFRIMTMRWHLDNSSGFRGSM